MKTTRLRYISAIATGLAIGSMLLLAGTASATELVGAGPSTSTLYGQWTAESQVPTPDLTIQVQDQVSDDCGAAACTRPHSQPIMIEIEDVSWLFDLATYSGHERDMDRLGTKLMWLHELGHVTDLRQDRTAASKRRYRTVFGRIMRYRECRSDCGGYGWWWATDERGRYVDPYEQFAMAYAYCAHDRYRLDPAALEALPGYGYEPTQTQHRRACRLIVKWF